MLARLIAASRRVRPISTAPAHRRSPHRRRLVAAAAATLVASVALVPIVDLALPASPAVAAANPALTAIRSSNTFYVYVAAGENVDISFLKSGDAPDQNDARVTVRRPGAAAVGCISPDTAAVGQGCSWSNLTASTSGIWQIDFVDTSSGSAASADPHTWSIRVQSGATTIPGRVWTEQYNMMQRSFSTPADFSLWYLSEHGFKYRADYTGYNGIDSTFYSNAIGNALAGTCVSAYESADSGGPYSDLSRIDITTQNCGEPYKIFFEAPSASLPPTATLWNGASMWVEPSVVLPQLDALQFTQGPGTTRAGQFTFQSQDFTGNAVLEIDANNDGDYTDAVDRRIPISILSDGSQTVAFNGRDGQGDPIPLTSPFNARVSIAGTGEIHFTNQDVERRDGLQVQALNGPAAGSRTLHWNDTTLRTQDRLCTTPVRDGRAGVNSTGGVHGWPCLQNANDGVNGSWGDMRSIDDWALQPINEQVSVAVPAVPPSQVILDKEIVAGPSPVAGQDDTYDLVYRLTVRNPGLVPTSYDLDDETQFGTNVTIVSPPAVTNTQPGGIAPDFAWNGDSEVRIVAGEAIAASATHIWEVSVRVSYPATTTVDPADDCTLDSGETGTGLRNQASVRQPGFGEQTAEACRPTGFPSISKRGVVVSGPNSGSTSMAESGDVIEWTVQFQNTPRSEAEGVTLTDAILGGQQYVPGSLDVPGGDWSGVYSTTGGSVDPTDFSAGAEPAGVAGVGMTHPTNGFPTALGGSAAFPAPVDPSTATTGQLSADPAEYYCAASDPTIVGWDEVVVHNLAAGEYSTATLTIRDANGDPVAGWDGIDVTADLGDGVIDVASIPYSGATSELDVELAFDGVATGVFDPAHETPSINLSWTGDPIELCFRTAVQAVCDVSTIDNLVQLVYEPAGEQPRTRTAESGFDYIATSAQCFDLTKTATGRTYHGDGRWQVEYDIVVTSLAPAEGRYDLDDEFRFGTGITVAGTPAPTVANTVPGGILTEAGWTGADPTTRVVSGAAIPGGGSHGYHVIVEADVPPGVSSSIAGDCTLDPGESGTGFLNVATLSGADGDPLTAEDCLTPVSPTLAHEKTLNFLEYDAATDEYVVSYLVTQTATGEGLGQYDLSDTLRYGANAVVTATSVEPQDAAPADRVVAGWTGSAPNTLLVDDAFIDAGETHSYVLTIRVDVVAPPTGTPGECNPNEDFFNESTMSPVDGPPVNGSACVEPPVASVSQTKALIGSPSYDSTTQLWTVEYQVTETATGEGETFYTLDDQLLYGPNHAIATTAVAAGDADTPAPSPSWDGQSDLRVVTNAAISAGEVHIYRMTIQVALTAPQTGPAGECTEGEDFANRATLTTAAGTEVDEACGEPSEPTVTHDKRVTGAAFDNATDQWTISYEIDVVSSGVGTGFYTLDDELQFGPTVTVVGTPTVTGPTGTSPSPTWNGTTDLRIVTDQTIAGGATHTYSLEVVATVLNPPPPGSCQVNEDFYNTSTLTTTAGQETDDACLEPSQPALQIDKQPIGVAFDAGVGEYVTTYAITVTATGTGNRSYDLLDELEFPSNMEVTGVAAQVTQGGATTDPSWTGQAGNTLLADQVDISAGDVHVFEITVRARLVSPDPVVNDPEGCAPGSDFVNRAELRAAADVLEDNDCIRRTEPEVDHTKTLSEASLDPETGIYTLFYTLEATATATPPGQTFYDLEDALDFGPTVTVTRAEIVATNPDPLDGLATDWDGQSSQLLLDDQRITSGDIHRVEIEVDVVLDGLANGNDATACDRGVDLHNDATLTATNRVPESDSACAELPTVSHSKEVLAGPRPVPERDGVFSISYRLTAAETAAGILPAAYDLDDAFRFGPEFEVLRAPSVTTSPDPLTGLMSTWDGQGATQIVDNGVLAPGETQSIDITVIFRAGSPAPDADGLACSTLDEDLANTSSLTSNGVTVADQACAEVPPQRIASTGVVTMHVLPFALLALLLGVGAVFVARRRLGIGSPV